jgi:hypothetical protein
MCAESMIINQHGGANAVDGGAVSQDNRGSMQVYLSGPIEYAPDHGKAWRASLTPFLESLGHSVYDPAADERKNLSDEEMRGFRRWKSEDPGRFRATVRKIIRWDLDRIEGETDCVVAFWDRHALRGAGCQGEITLAHRRGIPVYLVADMPLHEVSGWILACADEVFTSFDELRAYFAEHHAALPAHAASQR